MEISLSTFILEVINFLILVWILKRFLYRPVLEIVARRRESIENTMAEAKRIEHDARVLKERYEKRLGDWESERTAAREKLTREIEEERTRQFAELRQSLDKETEKRRAAESRRLSDLGHRLERQGLTLGARFASHLLKASVTHALQEKLVDLFIQEFDTMSRDRIAGLLGNPDVPPDVANVSSAFALTEAQQKALGERIRILCGTNVAIRFTDDPSLMAGIRLTIGGCVLGLNLKDELDGYTRLGDVGA